MAKKRFFRYAIAAIIVLMIGIGIGILFSHTGGSGEFTGTDSISRQKAIENDLVENLVSAIKCYENVDDVTLNTVTGSVQVNIITKNSGPLTPESIENIEKLIASVYPDSTIEWSYSDKTDK